MAEPLWIWEDNTRRYRNTKTGRFIGINQMQDLRREFVDQQKVVIQGLIERYLDNPNRTNAKALNKDIRNIIKETYIDLYAMGAGGRNSMSHRDWGRIGAMVKEQYGYLNNLIDQLAKGDISPAQANARLKMYANSANEALWKGYSKDMPPLPAYPGDGSTVCLTNCQCTWEIVEVPNGFDCYWRLGVAEHCPDCIWRSQNWNPYHLDYGGA